MTARPPIAQFGDAIEVKGELLPCPFCGGADGDLVQGFTRATEDFAYWSVECVQCGCEIADDESQASADAHWNRRTTSALPLAHPAATQETAIVLSAYDAGLLGDGGGGDINWWQDYIRAELDRAYEFYCDQVNGISQ